tara:strand:- start:33 stop:1166 length:1134 start_codon:yes stop_codon:yes gene_type:complete
MKKITLLLTMLLIGFISHAQFDWSTSPLDNGWIQYAGSNGEGAAESWTWNDGANGPFMYITWEASSTSEQKCEDWLVSPLVEITNTSSGLSFGVQDQYPDNNYGSNLSVQVSTTDQSSGFSEVASFSEVDISPSAILSADLSAYEGSSIYIAFVWSNDDGDRLYLYDLNLENLYASAPDVCTNMAPVDTATDVEIVLNTAGTTKMVMFSWDAATAGDPSTSYDWYFGATADAVTDLVSGFDGTVDGGGGITWGTTVATGWQPNTTYYWKVASVNAGGGTDSPIFSFTTSAADPLGVEGFSIEALSVSPNPVKDLITINSPVGFDSVKVFNQLGQLVLTSSSDLMNNNKLDLSALNPGMYLMQINADNKSKTVNIIKE